MSNHEGMGFIRPPIFNGNKLTYWKTRTKAYLQSLGSDVWEIVERGYQYPAVVPIDPVEKKSYETNAKFINALLGSLSESEFVKVMQLNTAKVIWDKSIQSYEGDSQVKPSKLQTLKIQSETLNMHCDEVFLINFYE